jgi:hypothetical protein
MAEIKKYVCDVTGCGRQLASQSGSSVRIEIKTPPGWGCPAYSVSDLCDEHLLEFMATLEKWKIKLEADV